MMRAYDFFLYAATKSLHAEPLAGLVNTAFHAPMRVAAMLARNLHRGLSVTLIISLLATSTPAAPRTIMSVAHEWRISLAFWLEANELPHKLYRVLTGQESEHRSQEKQEDRDARVSRIQIYPGDVTVQVEQPVQFAGVAYDAEDTPVGGVLMQWRVNGEQGRSQVQISDQGKFEADEPGTYIVIAEGAHRQAQVQVTVLDGVRRRNNNEPPQGIKQVSTRDLPPAAGAAESKPQPKNQQTAFAAKSRRGQASRGGQEQRSHTSRARISATSSSTTAGQPTTPTTMPLVDDGWGDGNYWSADDPGNTRGDVPGRPVDDGAGSSNFQFTAPVLGLPGRGIDIALALTYNSRVWNKAGTVMNYDIDRDWPAPGFAFGFGKIVDMAGGGSMIVDANGTRHPFKGTITPFSYGQLFEGHTTDGTLIDYATWKNSSGVMTWGEINLPNGTQIHHYCSGPGGVFPTQIVDANGNYLTITYVNNTGPRIQTITDSLNRVITFYYDINSLLTAITAPGLVSGTRTVVRLKYRQIAINASFSNLTSVVRDSNPWVIEAIYYPGTNTGYWFGDSDSYSTYGMLAKVSERRNMGLSAASLNEQGTITSTGSITKEQTYNYPLTGSNLTDAPSYTSMTESWTRDGVNFDSATTTYSVNQISTPRTVTITLPNGTKNTQQSYNRPGQFDDGLVFFDEIRDANNTLLQSSTAEWQLGAFDSPRPSRVTATNERNQTMATEFSYGTVYNQVTEVRNYDFGGTTLLQATRTQYQNSAAYTAYSISNNNAGRHIFNLPLIVEVFAADNTTRVSRTEYQYDGQTLTNTPNVVSHAGTHDPFSPQYNSVTDARGNVTQVTTYADAVGLTGAVIETRRYDITGNMIKTSSSCCEQTTFDYPLATQYAYPLSQTRGSATDGFAQVKNSATYDFNTGLALSSTDSNGRIAQTSYLADTLRPQTTSLPSGAHTDFAYDDSAMTITETVYLEMHPTHTTIANQIVKLLNGQGQVRQEKALGAGGVFDFVDTEYDSMGRVFRQTRPYRSGDTKQWTNVAYDALSRATRVTAPDGSVSETYHNEIDFDASDSYTPVRPDAVSQTAPGETTLIRDAWGRERWVRTDARGRLVEVVEPNPSGSGSVATSGLVTTYSYNTLGNLTGVVQGAQTRSFKYDSLGRLTAQKLAETNATLNNAGTYIGSGTWSDVFTYDERSNLTSRTDARGVKTVYTYNSDPLNRLQSVSWDTTGFGDTAYPILAAATVTYQYRTKGDPTELKDVTQLSSITTAGIGSESYGFDSEGRVNSKTLTLTSRPSHPFVTDYIYDELNRVKDVRYPAEYGNGTQPRKLVHYDYDVASRFTGLTVDGQSHASQVVYNAASQSTSLRVGLAGANQIIESYGYEPQTGLLASQTIARSSTPSTYLLDLSYDYAGANGKRTGQLKKILNNLNHNKDRGYSYDALARLIQATGGPAAAPIWTQTYSYDRYGNRTSVSASGFSAKSSNQPNSQLAKNGNQSEIRNPKSEIETPSDPKAILPTDQRAARTEIDLPDALRTDAPRSVSDSSFNLGSRPASANPAPVTAAPQGPPVFTDDPLVPGVTVIKAVHITELRNVINQARARGGLAAASWAESVTTGLAIKASHIVEMRTRLGEARAALGLSAPSYTDPTLNAGMTVKAVHIQELRQRVTEALGSLPMTPDGHTSLSYDATTNRINTAGWNYDAAGNQTRTNKGGSVWQRFQYDAANRLVRVKADDNVTVIASYTYGDSTERLILEEGGVRTYYACDGKAEYTESGGSSTPAWSKSYIYFNGRLLSTLTLNGSGGEAIQYHHPDRLGTRLVTNAQDTTSFEQVTLPFGTALNAESTGATNRRFTSYDRSITTGLDYAINRHYDPQQGRFTQVDPIGMKSVYFGSPQSLNLYVYCTNDPINETDHNGLGFLSFIAKIFRVVKKILKWVVIAVAIALAVVFTFALLNLPGAQLLADIVFKGLGLLLKYMAKFGIMKFAEGAAGGFQVGLTGQILAGAWTVGAVANELQQRRRRRKGQDKKKQDPIVAIIVDPTTLKTLAELTQEQLDKYKEEQKKYEECVAREELIYHTKVETIRMIDERLMERGWIELFTELFEEYKKKIEKDLQRAAKHEELMDDITKAGKDRDEAIKKNCKEPTLPNR